MPTSPRIPKKENISHRADVGIRPYINFPYEIFLIQRRISASGVTRLSESK